jgi:inner membrane transporter RhtA
VSRIALRSPSAPPLVAAVAAMLSVQLGSALSVNLIAAVGPAGCAWLRLTAGAAVFLLIGRPPLRALRRRDIAPLVGLGVTTGLQTMLFLAAIDRIPLGTAVAVEFLGPLTVAAVRARNRHALVWPMLALVGVVLLTQPWNGAVDPVGIGFAASAAAGWAVYIMLTQHIGDRFAGIQGLSLTIPVAAVTAALIGVPQAAGHLDLATVAAACALALLLPVLPFALEMFALRRITQNAFGTLMALEPAIGVLLGLLVLRQVPTATQVLGIVLVVLAGGLAQRGGRRAASIRPLPAVQPQ